MRSLPKLLLLVLLLGPETGPAAAAEKVLVEMDTSAGAVIIELYEDAAPLTVANFLRYVDAGLYDGKGSFYRTVRMDNQAQNGIKIEVIQGGLGLDSADAGMPPIAHETTQDTGVLHKDGVISMARLDPGSASSEFFICINDQPALDYGGLRNPDGLGFAAFGKVIKGMDVVRQIQKMNTDVPEGGALEYTSGQMLLAPVAIERLRRLQHSAAD